jgi:cytochrome c biogenesis protein CcmG, thiol:disulfide interchange protein DsbE
VSRKKLFISFVAIALAAGIYFFARSSHHAQPAIAGNIAPDFSLPQLGDGTLTLSSDRGKVVLLDFWATWCEPCRQEIPHFVDLQNKYGNQGLQIIGISMDDGPEPVKAFAQQFKMNYPVVMGNAKIGDLYGGVLGLPIAFLLDRDGRIVKRHIGAVDIAVIEREIVSALAKNGP